jgi:hypothetical protein
MMVLLVLAVFVGIDAGAGNGVGVDGDDNGGHGVVFGGDGGDGGDGGYVGVAFVGNSGMAGWCRAVVVVLGVGCRSGRLEDAHRGNDFRSYIFLC